MTGVQTCALPIYANLSTVRARITDRKWTGLDGKWDLPPVPPLAAGDCENSCAVSPTGKAIINGKDADIYESDALFPLEPVRKVDTQVMRGWKMAQILYAPYAYNPVEGQIFQLSGDAIEITFERTSLESSSAGTDLTSADKVRDMTVNFAEMSGEYVGYAISADTGRYVIISTSAIQTASTRLADFVASKEARGFTVQVVTEGTWQNHAGNSDTGDAAAEHLRSWLQANYLSLNIKYVLLIGNPNPTNGDLPMKMCYPQDYDTDYSDCPTDFYYAELTEDWDTDNDKQYGEYDDDFSGNPPRAAEVVVGRIPYYGSTPDLDHILSKIIDYETLPETDISWHRNVLLPMNPSDGSTPGYQLGEEIKNDVLSPSWAYHRVYDSSYGLSPTPETTPCTVTNVTNAWKGSDFGAVFWWAHGSDISAEDVMNLSSAATLDDACPSFTFQCSCLNGKPETTTNLGYSLLKNGCISTVSASRVSWYLPGQTSFAGTPTNSGMTFEYSQRLIAHEMYAGDALNDLKSDVYPYDEVLWMNYLDFNLYGCPAVGLSTPPLTETSDASDISIDGAQLNGSLLSLGTAATVSVSFEWGTTSGVYSDETTAEVKASTGIFYFNLTGLNPGTTYYYKARAVGWGTAHGSERSFTTLTTPPSAATNSAGNITTTSAALNGYLDDLGTAESVTVSFEWGLTTAYGNVTTPEAKTTTGTFSADLSGLTAKTTYHFRAKAVGHGTAYGYDRTFTTLTIPPSVTTNDATNLATTSARLNGNLSSLGTATSVSVSFQWGTTPGGPYPNSTGNQTRSTTGSFYADLGSLTPGAAYYYRARAVGDGTAYGPEKNFTALTTPPSVTTGDASNIAIDGARLNGSLESLGTAATVSVSFEWGITSENYTYETTPPESKDATGTFHVFLGGLAPETIFYYRAKAVGHGDPMYGLEKSFKTGTPPSVTTNDATSVATTSATLNGDLTALGTATSVSVSFEWKASGGSYTPIAVRVTDSTGTFSVGLTGLTPGTTYYFKAKADGDGDPVYGAEKSFTALTPPSVTTNDATNVTTDSATLNGDLTALGTASSVTVSFEWKVSEGSYTPIAVGGKDRTGTFSVGLTDLTPGTTYYFKAKADGDGDPVYGAEKNFTTGITLPTVATDDASNVATTTVTLNGNLTALGTASSVTVSFEWKVSEGSYTPIAVGGKDRTGTFSVGLTDLTPGTTYYFKAKADGDGDPVYGEEKSFTTSITQPSVTTNDAIVVLTTSATLNGNLTALGTASSVTVSFEWKESGGSYTPIAVRVTDSIGTFSVEVNSLTPGTTHYYRAKAVGDGDPAYGEEKSFSTSITQPSVATNDATVVLTTSATLNGNLAALGTAGSVTVSFEWGTATGSYTNATTGQAMTVTGAFYFDLGSLASGTTYFYRAKADGEGAPVFGTEKSFTTSSLPDTTGPVISSVNSSSITVSGATITWSTNELATSQVEYGLTEEYGSTATLDATKVNSHSVEMTDLKAGKTYHYRVISKDVANNEKVSDDFTFTTASRSGGMPAWAWVLIGLGLLAATSGVFLLSRIAGKKPQADVIPQ